VWTRLSIPVGNAIQIAGLVFGCLLLLAAARGRVPSLAVTEMLAGLLLIYFSCHAIAHWMVGRLLGIRFRCYTVGVTANPQGWPVGLRWLMEHLPFFGVLTDKVSMHRARPVAKAAMWAAGVTSSALLPTLGAFWVWRSRLPMGKSVFLFTLIWSVGTVLTNRSRASGDYFKARAAMKN
jgi:hypothetical protein